MIPSSLSPHITVLSSPDLDELLEASSLPSLAHILQSFSPLPQVTTRTTALAPVPHASFALRFSHLQEIEQACKEDDDQRASRTIDWITARISKRCGRWVQEANRLDKDAIRTPWWDELRRCSEGDVVPNKHEGWNHPVAVILAVSTTAPNPLQAITTLHSRALQLPQWVDNNYIKYTLIVHPERSPLSNEEAGALFNAVKKQYGLHSYLLPLTLSQPAPAPVPVPAILPRLPPPPFPDTTQRPPTPTTPNDTDPAGNDTVLNTLQMQEQDIQHTARFTREFVVMSLIPWMEKCTVEWNENFSSTRRLPSRLFSSTRRLFGSPSPSPAPNLVASAIGAPGRSHTMPAGANGGPSPPSQQRRLAEFATILGDYKLAVTVWEALRKDSKGGSDILPLLLSPSASLQTLADAAITSIYPTPDLPPYAQVRSLLTAVRWEGGISNQDFTSPTLNGEQWLVWAAGNAEEVPSALMLAQAAFLSARKGAVRRAALCYVVAATRLEKCGIKLLTVHFLRKARELYNFWPTKELSPSYWESEGKSESTREGLEDIYSGIEHPLGRLLYTTGDVSGAVQIFLGLLRGASTFTPNPVLPIDNVPKSSNSDKLYLEDFRVAYNYFKSTESDIAVSALSLSLPVKLCVAKKSKLKFPTERDEETHDSWTSRLDTWKSFWKSKGGKANLVEAGKVHTNEFFWVDLVLHNPLDAEITLSDLTVVVQQGKQNDYTPAEFVEVEVLKEIVLPPLQRATVPISLSSSQAATINVTHAKYNFLGLLPCTESLASRGRRLHDTAAQRQRPTYAPDVVMRVEVLPSDHKLDVLFSGGGDKLVLLQGETKHLSMVLTNSGSNPIREAWLIAGPRDEIWVGKRENDSHGSAKSETWTSNNSLVPKEPILLPITAPDKDALQPGERLEIPAAVHREIVGSQTMEMVCVFRENDSGPFHITKILQRLEIQPLFDVTARSEPSPSNSHSFVVDLEVTNTSTSATIDLFQITSMSAQWSFDSLTEDLPGQTPPGQCNRVVLGATPWMEGSGSSETITYISKKLGSLLQGLEHETTKPPPLDLRCSHIGKHTQSSQDDLIMSFIHTNRLDYISNHISKTHPYIPPERHASIFPMYHPNAVHLVLFWRDLVYQRSGHFNVHGLTLGAGHAALSGILEEAEGAKVKRSMYAETRKQNLDIIDAIRHSEWNWETETIVVSVQKTAHISHNFDKGPHKGSVDFNLRNHSLTCPVRYTLKLQSETTSGSLLAPPYKGRLSFHGTIEPSQIVTLTAKLWIQRPGAYALGGWILETEIIPDPSARSTKPIRHIQEAPSDTEHACIIISDSHAS